MATKKTDTKTTTKSTATKTATKPAAKQTARKPRKAPAKKPTPPPTKQADLKVEQQRRQMSAIVLFAVGIFLLFVVLVPGENLWLWMHHCTLGLCGVSAYILPFIVIYIAVRTTMSPEHTMTGRVIQGGVLLLFLSGIIQTMFVGSYAGEGFTTVIKTLYENGKLNQGGGVLSAVVGWPLLAAFGRFGANLFLVLFMLVFMVLLSGKNLLEIFYAIKKPFQSIESSYADRRTAMQERAQQQDEIMPTHPVTSSSRTVTPSYGEIKPAEDVPSTSSSKQAPPESSDRRAILDEFFANEDQKANQNQSFNQLISKANATKEESSSDGQKQLHLDHLVSKAAQQVTEPGMPVSTTPTSAPPSAVEPVPIEQPASAVLEEVKLTKSQQKAVVQEQADEVQKEIQLTEQTKPVEVYKYPPFTLLKAPKRRVNNDLSEELRQNAELLVDTLKSFGVQTRVIDISRGPTVTRYELQPSAGVKISKITNLADDIALNLASAGVRIEAPIPNKAAVGIEVPNKSTDIVTMRELIESTQFRKSKSKLSVALGRDISGQEVVFDIGKMPHMLIAGATGSGKSVCINTLIMSILYKANPDEVKLLMIDPKVVELGVYNGIPHLLVPVVTDPRKAAGALGWAVTEMLGRYKLFAEHQVRDLAGYNELAAKDESMSVMPQIVIIIDELADLMMAAPNEVEDAICRLAQMARAAGMHLVIATQRPSVDVITGVIKANIPSRIAFSVSSQVDSRTIIDSGGAEKLLGRGDMLFYPVGLPKPTRLQCCFVSDKEVEAVVEFVKNASNPDYDNKIMDEIERQAVQEKKPKSADDGGGFADEDELLPQAIEIVVEAGQAATSFLQRKLRVGYARAARLIDDMESQGIVGPSEGSKPRQVLMSRQQWIEMRMLQDQSDEANDPSPEQGE